MSNYIFGTKLRYIDYLQAKSFENSLRTEISSSSRRIIASNEELARDHISVLESTSLAMMSGFDQLSFDLRKVSEDISELNATFQWGFSEVLTCLGGLNDSLDELIEIAKTPAQTWAYNQFEIARDAFRQELYDDAVQYLNRAISGYGDQTGYSLEYRFHYLLGMIRLGSFKNHSKQIVDPQQAEQAFLNAAKYARHDHPKEAARSLLGAGWAAYCQGDMQAAERHTREAVALDDSLAEAYFQLAKILMHCRNPKAALIPLRTAITLDRGYTLKSCSDGDFTAYQQEVDSLIEDRRQEVKTALEQCLNNIESGLTMLEKNRAEKFNLADEAPIIAIRKIKDEARQAALSGTYYAYLDALMECASAGLALQNGDKALQQLHEQRHAEIEADRQRRAEQVARRAEQELANRREISEKAKKLSDNAMSFCLWGLFCFLPLSIVGLVLGVIGLTKFSQGEEQQGKEKAIGAVLIGGVLSLICLSFMFSRHMFCFTPGLVSLFKSCH